MRHVFTNLMMAIVLIVVALTLCSRAVDERPTRPASSIAEIKKGDYHEVIEQDANYERHGLTMVFVKGDLASMTTYEHGKFVEQFDYHPSGRKRREIVRLDGFQFAALQFEDEPNAVGVPFDFLPYPGE